MEHELANTYWETAQKNNDRRSFDRLYLAYWERLYGFAWARTRDTEIAKELIQEVFVILWEKRAHLAVTGPILHYLTASLKNLLIDYFHSEKAREHVIEHAYTQMEVHVNQPDFSLSYQIVEGILEEELAVMPENMRKSLQMRLDHFSVSEIANRLGLADQTVYNLLSQASGRLKRNLPRRFEEYHSLHMLIILKSMIDFLMKT